MNKRQNEVPAEAGVYALIHRKSGTCFVGPSTNLRRRWAVWRSVLGKGAASKRRRGFPDHPRDEWEFKIVRSAPDMSPEAMGALVDATIERATKQGLAILNRAAAGPAPEPAPASFDARALHLRQMPTPIHDAAGRSITYAEAAKILGRPVQGVKISAKRLRGEMDRTGDTGAIPVDELKSRR